MEICKTCKHWDHENKLAEFTNITNEEPHKVCENPKVNMCEDSDGLYSNNDGYHWLTTGPSFGCIHHEIKNES